MFISWKILWINGESRENDGIPKGANKSAPFLASPRSRLHQPWTARSFAGWEAIGTRRKGWIHGASRWYQVMFLQKNDMEARWCFCRYLTVRWIKKRIKFFETDWRFQCLEQILITKGEYKEKRWRSHFGWLDDPNWSRNWHFFRGLKPQTCCLTPSKIQIDKKTAKKLCYNYYILLPLRVTL